MTTTIDERMQAILENVKEKLGGIIAVFLLDQRTADILGAYPQIESENLVLIGSACSKTISRLESESEDFPERILITDMELVTQDQQLVYSTRISPSLLLCIVGDSRKFKTGYAKRLVEANVKGDLLNTMERMGFLTAERYN